MTQYLLDMAPRNTIFRVSMPKQPTIYGEEVITMLGVRPNGDG